ncbi:MAG: hypothetical protein AMJ65_14520 [Phycisphaerae bacterium SG8_4]|nr:MAG: hypothetical protein AMJ65_14520 [Phycisphaerae bacterium SG8_4]
MIRMSDEYLLMKSQTYIQNLEAILCEVLDYLEDRADVVDGDDGKPEPNREMSLMTAINDVVAKNMFGA